MNDDFLTTRQLAKRWNLEPDTLKKWRGSGKGPLYHKVGRRINYGLEEIEEYELTKLRSHTSMPESAPTYLSKLEKALKEIKALDKKEFSPQAHLKNKRR